MAIFLIIASRDGRHWLVAHLHAGPAVFLSRSAAERHAEAIRASGVSFKIVQVEASVVGEL